MLRFRLALPFVLLGCALSHQANVEMSTDAAGPDVITFDASVPDVSIPDSFAPDSPDTGPLECVIGLSIPCVLFCGGDRVDSVCVEGIRQCPPGAIDPRLCVSTCPLDDPLCICESEPSAGDSCSGEVRNCGTCCPTLHGPNLPAISCVGGTWRPQECEELCPALLLECPVDVAPLFGTACVHERQTCGDPCCGTVCRGGVWGETDFGDCACTPGPTCGSGSCNLDQSCHSSCGPDDGLEFRCVALPAGCSTCECVPLMAGETCDVVDGQVRIAANETCG